MGKQYTREIRQGEEEEARTLAGKGEERVRMGPR